MEQKIEEPKKQKYKEQKYKENEHKNGLKRELKIRHIQMIAFGGVIGTGLFQSIGSTVKTAGPGGALLAYSLVGIMVFFIMSGLGEMAVFAPLTGSFETYAQQYVDASFSFALGWIYWFSWTMTIAAEIVGSAIAMKEWFPQIPPIAWCILFLTLLLCINLLSTKVYGEAEFWLASIKVITVIIFLVVGVCLIFGIFTSHPIGLKNYTYKEAPFVGGFTSVLNIFLLSGYAFQGEEMIGVTAGESINPVKAIKKSIKSIFFRVLIFYVGALFVIGAIVPYTQISLKESPFTMVFQMAGIKQAAMVMNIVVLIAVFSCANSGLYCSSRMLYAMARERKAPKILGNVSKKGVPYFAVTFTVLVSAICFLTGIYAADTVYLWLINASALCGFIAWFAIAFSHYRFRKGYVAQGYDVKKLEYKSPFYPLGHILTIFVCIFVILGQGIFLYEGKETDWIGLITTYSSIPIFFILMFFHKRKNHTTFVSLKDIDYANNKDIFTQTTDVEKPKEQRKVIESAF